MAQLDHQFQVTLSDDLAEAIASKVRSGAYASADEVLRDGLRALIERDATVERWLREEVVAGHDEYRRNPGSGIAAEDMMERFRRKRKHRSST